METTQGSYKDKNPSEVTSSADTNVEMFVHERICNGVEDHGPGKENQPDDMKKTCDYENPGFENDPQNKGMSSQAHVILRQSSS